MKAHLDGYKIGIKEGLDQNIKNKISIFRLESFYEGILLGIIIGCGMVVCFLILIKSFGGFQ